MNGSRRKRIAKGAGVDVAEVNKLCKMQRQMADAMKQMGKMKKLPFGMGGGMGNANITPEMLSGMGMPPGLPRK
jgi:signal recognition particle subunit SRP54